MSLLLIEQLSCICNQLLSDLQLSSSSTATLLLFTSYCSTMPLKPQPRGKTTVIWLLLFRTVLLGHQSFSLFPCAETALKFLMINLSSLCESIMTINQLTSLVDRLIISANDEIVVSSAIIALANTVVKVEYMYVEDEIHVSYVDNDGPVSQFVEIMRLCNVSDRNRRYLAQMILATDY